ncbi:MAG: peptidylprolyl isomerase [Pseudomonadota bacterium]
MNLVPKALTTRESPRGLEYIAMVFSAALDTVSVRDLLSVAGAFVILFSAAGEAVRGPLATPAPDLSLETTDPVLVEVGATPIRASDARAQAVLENVAPVDNLPLEALFSTGLVDTAADQVALAKAAEQVGLTDALEIKAELALARRKILSSAFLDLAVQQQVTDRAVRKRYDEMVATAAGDAKMDIQRILLETEEQAEEFRAKILRGASFSRLAKRFSKDASTMEQGGHMADLSLSAMPLFLKNAVSPLRAGDVSMPIETDEGWYLVRVEARVAVFMPPYSVMEPHIRRSLRDDVISATVDLARSQVPIRLTQPSPELKAKQKNRIVAEDTSSLPTGTSTVMAVGAASSSW